MTLPDQFVQRRILRRWRATSDAVQVTVSRAWISHRVSDSGAGPASKVLFPFSCCHHRCVSFPRNCWFLEAKASRRFRSVLGTTAPEKQVLSAQSNGATKTTSSPDVLGVTHFIAECELPTEKGSFRLRAYRSGNTEPTVVIKGRPTGENVLVRVHDQVSHSVTAVMIR
jgi:hypothetical protein